MLLLVGDDVAVRAVIAAVVVAIETALVAVAKVER